jgi:Ricin-type beta-trefoil lectin domain
MSPLRLLRPSVIHSLVALAALAPAAGGCLGAEAAEGDDVDRTEAAIDLTKTYEIVSVNSGLSLDVTDKSTADGAKLQQWAYGGGANQQWKLQSSGSGTYEIIGVASGKCADVTDVSDANGALVQVWSCTGGANQQWKLQAGSGGAYEIVSVNSGKCLDVMNVSKSDGAAVQQWSCTGGANQQWKLVAVGAGGGGGAGGSGTSTASIEFAPYFESWAWGDSSFPFTSLVDLKAKTGVNGATIAFVLSNGGCTPTQDVQNNQADVDAFKAGGGLVKASFGGADGTYLDAACSSASALAGAIGAFVDETGITDLDFDVEQGPVMTTAMNQKRGEALKQVQDEKGIKVSFTLPVNPTGLDGTGVDVVKQAASAGVTISHVNLMVMDYGPGETGSMSGYAEQALTATQGQLLGAVPGLGSAAAWSMLGATPMIGQNDQSGEIFTLADAASLLAFAQQKKIGLLSFWSMQRDRTGSDYNEASTVNTKNYQFSAVFKAVQ